MGSEMRHIPDPDIGELWVDTSEPHPILKIFTGEEWLALGTGVARDFLLWGILQELRGRRE